jgi:hypothetical protein
VLPERFNWLVFAIALVLMAAPVANLVRQSAPDFGRVFVPCEFLKPAGRRSSGPQGSS